MGIFSLDNAFGRFLNRLGNWTALNFLFLLCCIPVLTIGPSAAALYAVSLKMARGEEIVIAKSFFAAFKENFKQGLVVHLIMLLCGAVLLLSLFYIQQLQTAYTFYSYFKWAIYVVVAVYAMVLTYVYPLLAAFENTVKNTLRNALILSVTHLIATVMMLAMTAGVLILCYFYTSLIQYALFFYLFCGVAVTAFMQSKFFVNIFAQYSHNNPSEA